MALKFTIVVKHSHLIKLFESVSGKKFFQKLPMQFHVISGPQYQRLTSMVHRFVIIFTQTACLSTKWSVDIAALDTAI